MNFRTLFRCSAALAVVLPVAPQVYAQDNISASETASGYGGITDIIVTAQKRDQSLQDVGVSVTALGSEALATMGTSNITAIAMQVPGLQFNQYNSTVTVFNIRGVSQNDFADHLEAPVAVYADEAYVAATGAVAGMMYDLDHVEILRGPQGTLFGRNATGGLIHLISKKPTDVLDGFLRASYGSFDTFNAEGGIGGPLAEGLRGRLSFAANRSDGYVENLTGRDPKRQNNYALRAQIEADVGNRGEFYLKVHGIRNIHEGGGTTYYTPAMPDADGLGTPRGRTEDFAGAPCTGGCDLFGYQRPADLGYYQNSTDFNPEFNRTVYGGTARYTHDLDFATLTLLTDYLHLKKRYQEDSDVSPLPSMTYSIRQNLDQFSQEVRLSNNGDRLNWVAGLYYLNIKSKDYINLDFIAFGSDNEAPYSVKTNSYAAFGQVEYKFTDTLTGIVGARYTTDRKRFTYELIENGVSLFEFNPTLNPDLARRRFNNLTGKIGLDYKPDRDTLLYVSVNRGAKSGNWASPSAMPVVPEQLPHGQERLTNYEGGFKLTLLDRHMRLNGAIFYYDYKNYQAFSFINQIQSITNRDAWVKGAELEVQTVPFRGMNINLGASMLDTKVKNLSLPSGRIADRRLPQAPKLSINGLVRYSFDTSIGTVGLQVDGKYDSGSYFSVVNAPLDWEGKRFVGNARIDLATVDSGIELAFFVQNMFDKKYRVFHLDLSGLGLSQGVVAAPRSVGFSITKRFGG